MSDHDRHFEAYKIAVETRRFEIDLYWKRSLFFWGFIATAAIMYGSLKLQQPWNSELSILISCFGFICSLCWSLVNRGSKYWQEQWESKVNRLEKELNIGCNLFDSIDRKRQNKGGWFTAQKFSVSKLAMLFK